MKFTIFTNIITLSIFVYSKPPHLFGNGCIAANNQLFMVAYTQLNTEEEHVSYYMDIPTVLNPKEKIKIEWKPQQKIHIFPGELVEVGYYASPSHGVYYVLNEISQSEFIENKELLKNSKHLFNKVPLPDTINTPDTNPILTNSKKNTGNYFREYLEALPKDIRIAVNYNQKRYFLDDTSNFTPYGNNLNFITIQNEDGSKRVVKTEGEAPVNKKGFSATVQEKKLFVLGGELAGSDTDSIYIIDLTTLEWSKHTVKGFHGARSGCLYYSSGYLIHAFGVRNGSYISSTQLVDTKDWSLIDTQDTPDEVSSSGGSILVPSIVGITCGILLIITIVILIIHLKRCRVHENDESFLQPPEYIIKSVWAEPKFSRFEMDLMLTTEFSYMYFDSTLRPPSNPNRICEKLVG